MTTVSHGVSVMGWRFLRGPLNLDPGDVENLDEVRLRGGDVEVVPYTEVDYMDVSPRQMVSVATAMIPFLEHDDANRALMGANMQKQAVPLVRSEAPLVGTGMEQRAAYDAGDVVITPKAGVVENVTADVITIMDDEGQRDTYILRKFERTNQGTNYNQTPLVSMGERVEAGQVLADGPQDADRIDTEMLVEPPVLDGDEGARQVGRQFLDRDHPAAGLAAVGQQRAVARQDRDVGRALRHRELIDRRKLRRMVGDERRPVRHPGRLGARPPR